MTSADLSGLSILVLEDDPMLRRRLESQMQRLGASVKTADSLQAARALLPGAGYDFALLDVNLPDGLGTDLLKQKRFPPDTGVIVMTAHGGVDGAVEAMRFGALDYLVKPFEPDEVPLVIERARQSRQTERAGEHRRGGSSGETFHFSPSLAPLEARLRKIVEADQRMGGALPPVLIQGETGTGKTAVARWLHQNGPRSQSELVEVNCSALPDTLAESELFGHELGAFTDARKARMGLFEAAHGGTLFLDELPSLSLSAQAKVLTAIEDGKIRRVGANKAILVDARLIAATNKDLPTLVAAGGFREDLYHRLDLYRIVLPPLRERGADILELAELFAERLCRKHRLAPKKISGAGGERLRSYRWPGNVRELSHELERAIVFEESPELDFAHLPATAAPPAPPAAGTVGGGSFLEPSFQFPDQGFRLEETIDRLVQRALDQAEGNVSAAARLLGVPRDYVRYRVNQKNRPPDGNQVSTEPPAPPRSG